MAEMIIPIEASPMLTGGITKEEAEAALPELKRETTELLGEMRAAEAKAHRMVDEQYAGDFEAAWEDEEFREAVYRRRRYAFAWGGFVHALKMQPLSPFSGEVRVRCDSLDGEKVLRWKEGAEGWEEMADAAVL